MGDFSNNGYSRDRLEDYFQRIKDGYKIIFGENIDLSPDSQDGQIVGILSEIYADLDQFAEAAYKSFNPQESQGTSLSSLVLLNGIRRKDATSSNATITCTGTNGTVIPAGSAVKTSDSGERFIIDFDISISSGTGTGSCTAENTGAVQALAGTLTVIDTPISGWESVTNNNDADLGNDEETDAELRTRRRKSVAISARNVVDTIFAQLSNLENVVAVRVLENVEDEDDPTTGIRAHGIRCIVQGGDDEKIANTIWLNKTGGSPTDGDQIVNITDSQGAEQEIRFDRPNDVAVYIDLTVQKFDNYPADGDDQIKREIVDYFENDPETAVSIGDDVSYNEIFRPAYRVDGFSASSLKIGTSSPPTGETDISINFDELARFDTSRINIYTV